MVTADDMEREGSLSVAHALRFTPGVFFMPTNSGKTETIYIRGFNEEATGYYFDGIPINDIYEGNAAGGTDLMPFFGFGLSEIQISKGYTSPSFSSGKMGGAINMVSTKPKDKLEIRAGYTFVANNEHRANAQVGSNWGEQYFQLTYSGLYRKSLHYAYGYAGNGLAEGPVAIPSSYNKTHMLSGKYGFTPTGNHEYSLNFYYQSAKRATWTDFPFYDKSAFYLLGDSRFNDMVSLNSKLWYAMNGNRTGGARASTTTTWAKRYDDYSLGITETVKLDFDKAMNLKIGFLVKNDNHKSNLYANNQKNEDWKVLNSSIFTEWGHKVNDIFRYVLSASYDRHDGLKVYSIDYTTGQALITNGVRNSGNLKNKHLQGGSVQAITYYDVGDVATFYINVGYKSNIPKIRTLYAEDSGTLVHNGAKNLTTENLINAEVGAKIDWGSGQFEAAVFYNYITNMIVARTITDQTQCQGSGNCYTYDNADSGWSVGGEASIKQGFWDDKLVLGANYAYLHKKVINRNNGNFAGSQIFNVHPRQNINFNILIAPIRWFDVNLLGQVQTSRYAYVAASDSYIKLPTIFLLDLVANYYVTNTFKLTFGAYNLADINYNYTNTTLAAAQAGGLPGRRVFAGFEYRF